MSKKDRLFLLVLIAVGLILEARVLYFWRAPFAAGFPAVFGFLFLFGAGLLAFPALAAWYLYLNFKKSEPPAAPAGLSVDVFVTAYHEDVRLVEETLTAARRISYPHRTFLLDDGRDPACEALAGALDVGYLTRADNVDSKAGNINAALARTSGDFLATFDVDHAPSPEFLDRTLGFFRDERVGFVQAMQTFSNSDETLIAQAAAETNHEYFNISAVCKAGVGAACLHGTNAVIRRTALESVGGYLPGLAEDLETSIALHARGWRSEYVCEPLGPGLVPATLAAYWIQQRKWSRGVGEAAFNALKTGRFFRLEWKQALAYLVRFTYYSVGLTIPLGGLIILHCLLFPPSPEAQAALARLIALSWVMIAIRCFMLRVAGTDARARRGIHFKGYSLVFFTWPVYLASLARVCLRIPFRFVSTPKDSRSRLHPWEALPQLALTSALAWAVVRGPGAWARQPVVLVSALSFILGNWLLPAVLVVEIARARGPKLSGPAMTAAEPLGGPVEEAAV